ncbi:glycerol-3-phosphate acyltransferase [Marivivens niveibacter]|uniref:Glycerol-3-phosphate acyltransferase n=1 Tax=Marivivens niveibacter TaxID=1930667 RepID=A0A251X012_9RHOB|nr:glycerol-3-phosphate 1-O-acyltransferase PlsY [Marivivens niveibacter]OUD10080.1 glycerol-3-phosphate acyltransferase [Marivivens niveibacter]
MTIFATDITTAVAWASIGYLLGSIPFGILLARVLNLGDLRKIGSGNIGATNVLRTGNKKAAAATLLLDGGKGAVAVLIARAIAGQDAAIIAGLFAFIGHCFPVWLKFKGGKGVATFIGIMLAIAWPVGLAVCATWLITAVVSRYSSLSALLAAGMSAVYAVFLGYGHLFGFCIVLAVLIYWRHAENIRRLRAGTESKIGKK